MSRPLFRLRDIMPKGLYWRTLLIIVAPAALLQLIITLVFLDDHWQATSKRMSQGVAADVALIIQLYEREPTPENFADLQSLALRPGMPIWVLVKAVSIRGHAFPAPREVS